MDTPHSPLTPDQVTPNTREHIDFGFACLETTLMDYWDRNIVPVVLRTNTKESISTTVQVWWELMVEASCVRNELDRTNYQRTHPAGEVETLAMLHERLKTARAFMFVDDLLAVRELTLEEKQAVATLDSALAYYDLIVVATYFNRQ